MVSQEEYLEHVYGPLAQQSEHRRGDLIRYTHEGKEASGTVMWICAPQPDRDPPLRLVYVVQDDAGGPPDFVFPADVLSS
jgi:hypothetical protein